MCTFLLAGSTKTSRAFCGIGYEVMLGQEVAYVYLHRLVHWEVAENKQVQCASRTQRNHSVFNALLKENSSAYRCLVEDLRCLGELLKNLMNFLP